MNANKKFWLLVLAVLTVTGMMACTATEKAVEVVEDATAVFTPATHPDVDYDISCRECHAEVTPDVYATWDAGPHGQVNVRCFVCHGSGDEEFQLVATPETCRGCHDAQYESFVAAGQESCFSCHDGHALTFHSGGE